MSRRDKREQTAADRCGMSLADWRAARERTRTDRSRGRACSHRPEATLWEPVDGQEGLFPEPSGED
jgi:hypothetical protein